ncbi:MAG: T9SS type A sorting domain-containing protein [candidate division KSB1 bacterium]|nr:T9SS type A sorting domain-containing protein [candidate division KSB1 bacterium]MDZ7336379.1 T9SS type A sorting domain-containing protein [candidate division KSB1 bacterium]MDZ7401978.1 T9SS type A sorting domain-containing protein [candidate division KSB1 bacterium]
MIKQFWFLSIIFIAPATLLAQGSLLLVGGGGENYNDWSDEPYRWFVQQADSGKIINIDVDAVSDWYPQYFKSFGAATTSEAFRIPNRTVANDSATYFKLISASGIFIEGGDQWKYVDAWNGTLVEEAIHFVFQNGGAIGGTSAGLAVLGEVVFDAKFGTAYPEDVAYNPYHSRVHLTDDFLKILPNVLTDSHFHPRGRLARIVAMLARRIVDNGQADLMGVGVCENTAMGIDPAGNGTVFGDGTVTILYRSNNSKIDCKPGQPLTFTNIVFHELTRGAVFNFKTRTLVEPGPYLQPVTQFEINNQFSMVNLNGTDDNAPNLGSVVINGITSQQLAAWRGQLSQSVGENKVPNSVIIHKLLWENSRNETYYYENRWVGGIWGIAEKPGYRAIYLNGDSDRPEFNAVAQISEDGILAVNNGLVYVLDTQSATHYCTRYTRTGNRATNYRGLVNARLHCLKAGDQFDLNVQPSKVGIEKDGQFLPSFELHQNYPNPFNITTTIGFSLTAASFVKLAIFNIRGEIVTTIVSGILLPGDHRYVWNAEGFASGMYIYRIEVQNMVESRKLIFCGNFY